MRAKTLSSYHFYFRFYTTPPMALVRLFLVCYNMNLVRIYTWTLNEPEPQVNGEFSDHGTIGTLSKCKPKAQYEVSKNIVHSNQNEQEA